VHFANYSINLVHRGDSIGLKKAYEKAKFKYDLHDEIYLMAIADIIDVDQNNFALENFKLNPQSFNLNMKKGYYTLKIGRKDMMNAASFHEIGDYYFKQNNYVSSLEFFEKAVNLNPYELTYRENLANTHLKLGNFQTAADILTELIDVDGSTSIKVKYLRVLAYLNLKDFTTACKFIEEIKDNVLVEDIELERFCN
jgi:tetratricopeptide (TPR) repeat protein